MKGKKDECEGMHWKYYEMHSGIGFGLLLLLIGVFLILKDTVLKQYNVSTWAVILIMIGLWMIIKRMFNRCC